LNVARYVSTVFLFLLIVFLPFLVDFFTPEARRFLTPFMYVYLASAPLLSVCGSYLWLSQIRRPDFFTNAWLGWPVLLVILSYTFFAILFASGYKSALLLGSQIRINHECVGTLPELLYFSIVTGSTLGYGDGLPHGPEARSLVCMQVIVFWILLITGFLAIQKSLETPPTTPPIGAARTARALAGKLLP